ncbi:Hypothetical protein, putative, partial [Bodo saltans]
LGAAALHAASPFRYLESVVQSGAAKIASSLPSSAIKNMLKHPTTTILPTRQVVSLTEVLNESQDSHETRRTSQQHQRTFVTLTQMKELKNLLRTIARQQQTKNQSKKGRERFCSDFAISTEQTDMAKKKRKRNVWIYYSVCE